MIGTDASVSSSSFDTVFPHTDAFILEIYYSGIKISQDYEA